MQKTKGLIKKPEKSGSSKRKGIGGWLLLVFLMSVWMFIVGILVGRGTAPVHFDIEKLQKELSDLKKGSDLSAGRVKKKTDLNFYEALKENGESVAKKEVPSVPGEKRKSEKAVEKEAVRTGESVKKPAEKKIPANTVKAEEPKGNMTIQVAALKDPSVAGQMVDRLKKKDYEAYRTVVKIPGKGTWYRIRIGSYQTRAEAVDTLKKLKQEDLNGFLVNK